MANGNWNKLIEVDMTTGEVKITERHVPYLKDYIGGQPLAAKLLWEALKDKPGIDPLGPENVFMIMCGPMSGTPIPGAGSRYVAYCKSGITKAVNSPYGDFGSTVGFATSGGKGAAFIKMAGYDGIYVTGQSATPKYLHIDNDIVELLDADEYWGMTVPEYEEAMQAKHGYKTTIISIGPAGEAMIGNAAIISEGGRAAGRGGCGPVMGSKKLKGICVYGSKAVPTAESWLDNDNIAWFDNMVFSNAGFEFRRKTGSIGSFYNNHVGGNLCVRNHIGASDPNWDKTGYTVMLNQYFVHSRSCYGCPVRCMKMGVGMEAGRYKGEIAEGPEYEHGMVGSNLLMENMNDFGHMVALMDEYGFDCIGGGGLFAYALEAYENGVITSDMINGIKMEWGNAEEITKFAHALCDLNNDTDIWKWLRVGSTYAAKKLDELKGTNSQRYAMNVKNHSFAAWAISNTMFGMMGIAYSFCTRGACHSNGTSVSAFAQTAARNTAVFCSRGAGGMFGNAGLVKGLKIITGIDYTEEDLLKIGARNYAQERLFNALNGFDAADDELPDRIFEDGMLYGPKAGQHPERSAWETARDKFYTDAGWDSNGIPTEARLKELGMDDYVPYVAKAIEATK